MMEDPISVDTRSPEQRAEVRARYPGVYFPNPMLEPLWYGRRPTNRIAERRAIVDENKGNVFAICTDKYGIVHHEDIIMMVEEVVQGITQFGKIEVVPRTIKEGGRLVTTLKFPEAQTLIREKDAVFPKVDVFSSYDFFWKLRGKFGAYQLKCTNGMGVWKTFETFAKRHLVSLVPEELQDTIIKGLEIFDVQLGKWKEWAKTTLTIKQYEDVWPQLPFSKAERERIENLPEIETQLLLPEAAKGKELTVWSMNSVLTQFATHEIQSEMRKIELEQEIAQAMDNLFDRIVAKHR